MVRDSYSGFPARSVRLLKSCMHFFPCRFRSRSRFLFRHQLHLHRRLKRIGLLQCFQDQTQHSFAYRGFVPEPDLEFVWMHIDVHGFIGNLHLQCADREFSDHHPFPARCLKCGGKNTAVHHASVDEKVFLSPVPAGIFTDTDISVQQDTVRMPVYRFHGFYCFRAEYSQRR